MAEVVLKRKNEDDATDHSLKTRIMVLLEGRSLSIPLTEWTVCSKLLSDASEAIHLAIQKIDILENYFQKVDESTVSKGESEYKEVDTSIKFEVQVMEAHYPDTTQMNDNVSVVRSVSSDMKTEETNHEHNTSTDDQSMVDNQILNIEENSFKTFMDNLKKGITEEELSSVLENYGLHNFVIYLKHRTSHSFAFVNYSDEDNFNKALSLNKVMTDQGRKLSIRVCKPKRPKSKINRKYQENKDDNSASNIKLQEHANDNCGSRERLEDKIGTQHSRKKSHIRDKFDRSSKYYKRRK